MGPAVPQLNRTTSAETAGHVGTPQLRQLNMVNIEMFKHPNYYKNLRKLARNSELHVRPMSGSEASDTDQAISPMSDGSPRRRATGPGLKLQAATHDLAEATGPKPQAASAKLQAPSESNNKPQASSDKQQASSSKPQASSSKI